MRGRIMSMLDGYSHLRLIEHDVFHIADRIQEYDERMFIVLNLIKGKYEVHSFEYAPAIAHPADTIQLTLPFAQLDARALQHLYDNDIRVHGKNIFRKIEQEEEAFEKAKKRDFSNWVQAVASETKSMFAKDAWLM